MDQNSYENNKRQGLASVKEKLDRATRNIEWILKFPKVNFYILTVKGYHHSSIIFVFTPKVTKHTRPLRFHGMWFKNEEFEEVIRHI